MGTGSRKTWLEKQSDAVQMDALAMDDAGWTLDAQIVALKKKHSVTVKRSAYHGSMQRFRQLYGAELKVAALLDQKADELTARLPGLEPKKLVKRSLLKMISSREFQSAIMPAKETIAAAHKDAELGLKERHIVAVEEQNALKRRDQDLLEKRIAAMTGGLDAREIYLSAAKDVLKKLRTYADLKPGLDRRQAEIVNELAGSAESFARSFAHE